MGASLRTITPHRPLQKTELVCNEFASDAAYKNWRPNGTDDWLLIYSLSGLGRIVLPSGAEQRLGPGSALLYPPNRLQDYATDPRAGRWRIRWAHFHPRSEWLTWLAWPEVEAGIRLVSIQSTGTQREIETALAAMISRSRQNHAWANELAFNALEAALLWIRADCSTQGSVSLDPRIRKAMDYLAANLSSPFQLSRLANHCGLSVSRLGHLFRHQLGISPQRYSENLRLQQAQRLLSHSSLTMAEVAAETGFPDPFYFSRRFRLFTRRSPQAWRKQIQSGDFSLVSPSARKPAR